MSLGSDGTRIVAALEAVENMARSQRWDTERPWRRVTHVWTEDGIVVVDMHDLGAKVAKKAIRAVVDVARSDGLASHAVTFITGRGRHSAGSPVLRDLTVRRLQAMARDEEDWVVQMSGAGRVTLITDPSRAPSKVTRPARAGLVILLVVAALGAWVCAGMPGVG